MKKILVTTDFSRNSEAAIRYAINLAALAPCELIFYNVNTSLGMDAWTQLDYNDSKDSKNLFLKDKLNEFIRKIYKKAGKEAAKTDYIVEDLPDVDKAIISYAQKCKADYICMSTRGGGIIDKFIGTNASSLITISPIPLIVIPHNYRIKPLKSILYASDIENIGAELNAVEKFAIIFNTTIDIFHYDYFMEQEEVKSRLYKIDHKFKSEKITFHFKKFYPGATLLSHLQDDVRKSRPSIIAMFTKQNKGWFERIFISSKTAELGFDTKTPLLVFRK